MGRFCFKAHSHRPQLKNSWTSSSINCLKSALSMHHLPFSGAIYEDGTSGKDKEDDGIPPGGSHTYRWEATERAGPADPAHNCIPWMYHSHIESTFGMNSGLTGFMMICRQGNHSILNCSKMVNPLCVIPSSSVKFPFSIS